VQHCIIIIAGNYVTLARSVAVIMQFKGAAAGQDGPDFKLIGQGFSRPGQILGQIRVNDPSDEYCAVESLITLQLAQLETPKLLLPVGRDLGSRLICCSVGCMSPHP